MKRIDLVVTIHLPPPFPLLSRKGTGCCSKCATLTRNAEDAVKAMGINASVEEVTDIEKIISYGIMRTPAFGRYFRRIFCIFDTNFGELYYYDKTADDAERHVEIIPLYALSNL